jgi:riboflavin biosynthesis pyrimidine reductase
MRLLELGTEIEDALTPYAAVDRTPDSGRCWVTAHMVTGLDGCAAVGGRVGALSTKPDKALFADMRTLADIVLVGARTVREEGYGPIRLSPERAEARAAKGLTAAPPLAIVSRSLDLDWQSRAFTEAAPESRTVVVTCADAPAERLEEARQVAEVIVAGQSSVEPDELFAQLAAGGRQRVLCEGGPSLLGELVQAGHVDELCLTVSPMMGGDPLPVAVFPPGASLTGFSLRHVLQEDDTLFLRYEVDRDGR